MTIDDIKTLIAADESRTLELKKTTGELRACLITRIRDNESQTGYITKRHESSGDPMGSPVF